MNMYQGEALDLYRVWLCREERLKRQSMNMYQGEALDLYRVWLCREERLNRQSLCIERLKRQSWLCILTEVHSVDLQPSRSLLVPAIPL